MSADSQLRKDIVDFLVGQLRIDPERVQPESRFVEDFGADSLSTIEVLVAFEERFDVVIPEEVAMDRLKTVQDLIDFVEQSRSANG